MPLSPVDANSHAVTKAIMNDRNGNVKEYLYDEGNRLVVRRDYTGRADRSQPTTQVNNRPRRSSAPRTRLSSRRAVRSSCDISPEALVRSSSFLRLDGHTNAGSDADPHHDTRSRGSRRFFLSLPHVEIGSAARLVHEYV